MIHQKFFITILIFNLIITISISVTSLYSQDSTEMRNYNSVKHNADTLQNYSANSTNANSNFNTDSNSNFNTNTNHSNHTSNFNPQFNLTKNNETANNLSNTESNNNNCNNNSAVQYYLLNTNYIIEGIAKHDGKTYDIKTSYGNVKIPSQNVSFVGLSRKEVYNYRRTQQNPTNNIGLMRFAEWCVSCNFFNEAISEYENALLITNDNITADIIRQRIISVKKIIAENNKSDNNISNTKESNVVSIDNSNIWNSNNSNHINAAKNLSYKFQQHVQPILIKNCQSCHSPPKDNRRIYVTQKFILTPNITGKLTSKNSHENLKTCLQYIDLEFPMKSNLLNFIVIPHATYTPPFNVESDEYNKIVEWIQLAAKNMPLIRNSEFAHLFTNIKTVPHSSNTADTYITAEFNTADNSSAKYENTKPNLAANLPASFQDVVDLQNRTNNKNSFSNNVTKNHNTDSLNVQTTAQPTKSNFPPTEKTNNKSLIMNPIKTTTDYNIPDNTAEENHVNYNADSTDPSIFNRMYHPDNIH